MLTIVTMRPKLNIMKIRSFFVREYDNCSLNKEGTGRIRTIKSRIMLIAACAHVPALILIHLPLGSPDHLVQA